MSFALLTLLLALLWAAATGAFNLPNLLLGAAIAMIALIAIRRHVTRPGLLPRLLRILSLAGLFFKELILSALRVARLVLRPDMEKHLHPAFFSFPLTVKSDAEITLLANLITLTPGTLSVDVSDDRSHLLIHGIDVPDKAAAIREIAAGFERRVMEAFR